MKEKKIYVAVIACALLLVPFNGVAYAIATIEGTTLNYIHADHLTGSNAVTNSTGGMVQLLDYYPYGSLRIDWKHGSFDEQRKFAGHERDRDTGLDYMNARYYDSGIGRFLSKDSAFLLIGDSEQFKARYKRTLEIHLSDPQNLNSYSYVNNNPLKYVDESGEILPLLAAAYGAFEIGSTLYDGYVALTSWLSKDSSPTDKALSTGSAIIGLYSIGPGNAYKEAGEWAAKSIGKADDVAKISQKYNWGNPRTLLQHFKNHSKDFGAKSPEEYARKASEFFQNAQKNGFETLYDAKEQTIRIYDRANNTFGAFRPSGETRSFYKPDPAIHGFSSNLDYWKSQKGGALWQP